MASGLNLVQIIGLYQEGRSLTEVAAIVGKGISTVRYHVLRAGCLRTYEEASRLAVARGKFAYRRGQKRAAFSAAHKAAIKAARIAWGQQHAKGTRITTNGYVEFTRGPHKGRHEHVVLIEREIGRRLRSDESVHHKDGNRQNNDRANLELLTRGEHSRLHGLINHAFRSRDDFGRFLPKEAA